MRAGGSNWMQASGRNYIGSSPLTPFFSAMTVTWSIGKAKESCSHWSIGSCRSRSDHSQDHSQMEKFPAALFRAISSHLISGGMSAVLLLDVCWRLGK